MTVPGASTKNIDYSNCAVASTNFLLPWGKVIPAGKGDATHVDKLKQRHSLSTHAKLRSFKPLREMAKNQQLSTEYGIKINAAPKACWRNAVKLLKKLSKIDGDYYYVEGFARMTGQYAGIAIEHGWVEDANGNELDPTLPTHDLEYVAGVRYTKSQVLQFKNQEPPYVWINGGFGGFRNKDYLAAHKAAYNVSGATANLSSD